MLTLLITGCGKSKNGNTSIVTPLPSEVTPSPSAMSAEERPPSETSSIDIPLPDAPPEVPLPSPYPLKEIPLEELGEDYTAEAAVLDGCVIKDRGSNTIHNRDNFDNFVSKCAAGESASIYFGTYRSYIDPDTGITDHKKFTLNLSRFDFDGEAYTVSSYKDSYINEKFEMAEVSKGEVLLYKERYQHFVISEVPSPGNQYSEVPNTRAYLFLHDDAYSYTDIFASVALAKTIPHYEILVEDMD